MHTDCWLNQVATVPFVVLFSEFFLTLFLRIQIAQWRPWSQHLDIVAANVKICLHFLERQTVHFPCVMGEYFYSLDCPLLFACWTSYPHWDNLSSLQPGPLCTSELLQRDLIDAKIVGKLDNSLSILALETRQLS